MKNRFLLWAMGLMGLMLAALYVALYFSTQKHAAFATYADLAKTDLIEKGWIPHFLPQDATNIAETHDLDTNTVMLSYRYQASFTQTADALTVCPVNDICRAELERLGVELPPSHKVLVFSARGEWTIGMLPVEPDKKVAYFYARATP